MIISLYYKHIYNKQHLKEQLSIIRRSNTLSVKQFAVCSDKTDWSRIYQV